MTRIQKFDIFFHLEFEFAVNNYAINNDRVRAYLYKLFYLILSSSLIHL